MISQLMYNSNLSSVCFFVFFLNTFICSVGFRYYSFLPLSKKTHVGLICDFEVAVMWAAAWIVYFVCSVMNRGKNTGALYRKCESHLYFLRWLRSFQTCRTMLRIFHQPVLSFLLWVECCGCRQIKQTDPQGQRCCGNEAGFADQHVSFRSYWAKWTTWCSGQIREYIQFQTDATTERHRKSFLSAVVKP